VPEHNYSGYNAAHRPTFPQTVAQCREAVCPNYRVIIPNSHILGTPRYVRNNHMVES
jgi:hypothetical protein